MKNLTTLIILITTITANPKIRCILNKLMAHTKINSLKQSNKNNDPNDIVIKNLSSIGNLNQMALAQKLILNYDRLPKLLKDQLLNCENDLEPLLKKCENFHGEKNCEILNKFTVVQKCPKNYKRDDHTRCVKDCVSEKGVKLKIIDYDCSRYNTYLLNQFKKFGSREECLRDGKEFCRESRVPGVFVEDCGRNFKRVAFLCVPFCYNEMGEEVLSGIRESERYCLKDYVSLGMPFYDL